MAEFWMALVVTLSLLEGMIVKAVASPETSDYFLFKSLGLSANQNIVKAAAKATMKGFMMHYKELMEDSEEDVDTLGRRDERRLRRVVEDEDELAVYRDRRRALRHHVHVGKNRAQTRAQRRERLASQSAMSQHSGKTSEEEGSNRNRDIGLKTLGTY